MKLYHEMPEKTTVLTFFKWKNIGKNNIKVQIYTLFCKKIQKYTSLFNYYAVNKKRCYIFSNIKQRGNDYSNNNIKLAENIINNKNNYKILRYLKVLLTKN